MTLHMAPERGQLELMHIFIWCCLVIHLRGQRAEVQVEAVIKGNCHQLLWPGDTVPWFFLLSPTRPGKCMLSFNECFVCACACV